MDEFSELLGEADIEIMQTLGDKVTLPDGRVVKGTFERPSYNGTLGGIEAKFQSPEVHLLDIDASGLTKGSVLIINNAHYSVVDPIPSGDGVTVIKLVETQPDSGDGPWK